MKMRQVIPMMLMAAAPVAGLAQNKSGNQGGEP